MKPSFAAALGFGALLVAGVATAQERPAYQFLRGEEDWRALRDPTLRVRPGDSRKGLALSPTTTFTLGGDLRLRYESYEPLGLGFGGADGDDYLLTRARLHADLRFGDTARVFTEVAFGGVDDNERAQPALQDGQVDLAQGYVELFGDMNGPISLRLGRQEMVFGAGRIVNPRDGPNVRLTFDAARLTWTGDSGTRVSAFVSRPVQPGLDAFDDQSSEAFAFWGVYLERPTEVGDGARLDVYYFGFDRRDAVYTQGVADETRHTTGVRWAGRLGGWDWDMEGALQFGDFGGADVLGYAVANEVGYTFRDTRWTPRLALRLDAVSGDDDPTDSEIDSFTIPFPKLPYLLEASWLAPANIIDVHPGVTINPRRDLAITTGYLAAWKHSKDDAFYIAPGRALPETASAGAFIGHFFQTRVSWRPDPQLDFDFVYANGALSDDLKAAGGDDAQFFTLIATARF